MTGEATEEDLEALASAALGEWDLEVESLSLHWRSENTVFRAVDVRGEIFALRIHRPGYHALAALESEHQWTRALSLAGAFVPEAVPTRGGDPYATVKFPGREESRHVGLVKWISGVSLAEHLAEGADPSEVSDAYLQLGRIVADFHDCTREWEAPSGFERHAWDEEGLLGEQPLWGRFWEIATASDEQRAQLTALRSKLAEVVGALPKGKDHFGMIHADLNANNVLRQEDRLTVIDFDDSGFGWFAFDLAVALWDRMVLHDGTQFDAALDALQTGYLEQRPDAESVVEQIPLFLLLRTLVLLSWMEDRPEAGYLDMVPALVDLALAQAGEVLEG